MSRLPYFERPNYEGYGFWGSILGLPISGIYRLLKFCRKHMVIDDFNPRGSSRKRMGLMYTQHK